MADTSKLKPGSVELKPEVASRCPFCKKVNPEVEVREMGSSADSVFAGFVMSCCKALLGCQMIAKAPDMPLPN